MRKAQPLGANLLQLNEEVSEDEVNDVRTTQAMTEEISRLKRIVAERVMQIDILKAVSANNNKTLSAIAMKRFDVARWPMVESAQIK